jgi:preprotein translocase subunit SecG
MKKFIIIFILLFLSILLIITYKINKNETEEKLSFYQNDFYGFSFELQG